MGRSCHQNDTNMCAAMMDTENIKPIIVESDL